MSPVRSNRTSTQPPTWLPIESPRITPTPPESFQGPFSSLPPNVVTTSPFWKPHGRAASSAFLLAATCFSLSKKPRDSGLSMHPKSPAVLDFRKRSRTLALCSFACSSRDGVFSNSFLTISLIRTAVGSKESSTATFTSVSVAPAAIALSTNSYLFKPRDRIVASSCKTNSVIFPCFFKASSLSSLRVCLILSRTTFICSGSIVARLLNGFAFRLPFTFLSGGESTASGSVATARESATSRGSVPMDDGMKLRSDSSR
mmetsp:Transcript_5639/g.9099  ORF Transcript_5639/g.9099 Transcript_5639/m.9099 type:complete len:258 (-) Transcript_5639:429-1202(-)